MGLCDFVPSEYKCVCGVSQDMCAGAQPLRCWDGLLWPGLTRSRCDPAACTFLGSDSGLWGGGESQGAWAQPHPGCRPLPRNKVQPPLAFLCCRPLNLRHWGPLGEENPLCTVLGPQAHMCGTPGNKHAVCASPTLALAPRIGASWVRSLPGRPHFCAPAWQPPGVPSRPPPVPEGAVITRPWGTPPPHYKPFIPGHSRPWSRRSLPPPARSLAGVGKGPSVRRARPRGEGGMGGTGGKRPCPHLYSDAWLREGGAASPGGRTVRGSPEGRPLGDLWLGKGRSVKKPTAGAEMDRLWVASSSSMGWG
ncbi:cold-inducible RNA-binding protein isoform X1 [Sciurus carolinensis]|uniref:cold-inducible RNA-binding protein isoform X1 n=1 Tax=Sciurus carolinensis TaxID=30640 RepID=UPI001FB50563|nr:cold-inducible RNA-binding protein isoform X1 [Sciurus carolinensis]XP_047387194.1 cold-inducible RNA-binding protein isoform X1 [Sciurus carolinensis]XP_047387195.1 cold-inducible RNA-binding protein isoform X1 [Sciurus carolinensis]XP_047387196.1 cold-inducible RNA-binding protein isoform X1 [Sciurus carolinensis]